MCRAHGQLWEVIGGWGTDGILVRTGRDLQSDPAPERLTTGSLVRELELDGDRLRYALLRGEGPEAGWVSTEYRGRMLLVPVSGALIFLHGATSSGPKIYETLNDLSAFCFEAATRTSGLTVVCPSSPVVPYTLFGGKATEVWFDRTAMEYGAPEDVQGIRRSVAQVDAEIDRLVAYGLPPERIGVAGMSMGGCLALHVAYGAGRYAGQLAMVVCLCSFLHKESYLDDMARQRFGGPGGEHVGGRSPPLYMAHGGADSIVSADWAEATRVRLGAAGVEVPEGVVIHAGLEHMMSAGMVEMSTRFILKHLGGARNVIYKYAAKERKEKKEHTFHLATSLNDFQELLLIPKDARSPCLHRLRVTLGKPAAPNKVSFNWFQIVVDGNWKKTLYPGQKDADSGAAEMLGPDEHGHGLNWQMSGQPGDSFEIVLNLGEADKRKRVTWKLQRSPEPPKEISG